MGTRQRLRDGEPLFQAGEHRGGFFIVLSGALEIIDRSGDAPRRLALHQPREFTGDVDILSRRRPIVSAVARGDTEVLHIASGDIRRIIAEHPSLGERILRAFIARRELLVSAGFQGLRVIGSEGSRHAILLCEFLARNQVPFTWTAVEAELLTAPISAHLIARAAYFVGVPLWEGTVVDELRGHYNPRTHALPSEPGTTGPQPTTSDEAALHG